MRGISDHRPIGRRSVLRGLTGRAHVALTLAPMLFSLSFVLTVYADSGSAIESLPRPLAVAGAAALLLQLALSAILWSRLRGSVAAMVVLLFIVSPLLSITVVLIGGSVLAVSRWRRFPASPIASAAAKIVAIVFAIALARVVTSPTFNVADLVPNSPRVAAASVAQGPDIFLLMLDGYPRSDTLALWGYDNAWFEQALRERGFEVATASHTDYTSTDQVLPTMFQMRHLDEIEELQPMPETREASRRALHLALDNSPALKRLSELGYTTISAGHPADYLTLSTDRYIDAGWLTDFEHQALNRTRLAGLTLPAVLHARRERVIDTLRAAPAVATEGAATFMFAHVMSPHTPIVFDSAGRLPSGTSFSIYADDSGVTAAEFHDAYAGQVHFLNHLVLESVDAIIANSPAAVVVVFSDHGSRSNRTPDADWTSTLFTARTPGRSGVFPNDVRPIEIFPRLLGAYFGDSTPIPEDLR